MCFASRSLHNESSALLRGLLERYTRNNVDFILFTDFILFNDMSQRRKKVDLQINYLINDSINYLVNYLTRNKGPPKAGHKIIKN